MASTERLRDEAKSKGLSLKDLSEMTKIPYGTLTNSISDNRDFSLKHLPKLLEHFPGWNWYYIITGKKLNTQNNVFEDPLSKYNSGVNIKYIPNLQAAAGYIEATTDSVVYDDDLEPFTFDNILKPDEYLTWSISGPSMEPVLHEGDIVFASKIDRDDILNPSSRKFNEGYVYVIFTRKEDHSCLVKRVYRNFTGGMLQSVTLVSQNMSYPELTISSAKIHSIWVIRALITKNLPEVMYKEDYLMLANEIKLLRKEIREMKK